MNTPPRTPCPQIAACPMFEQFRHGGTLAVFKINYCESQYERCARFQARARGETPPRELMPSGVLLTYNLVG